jgi:type VI protein secretion system component VasK
VPLAEDAAEDEVNEETRELNERIKETQREHRRFKRLGDLINERGPNTGSGRTFNLPHLKTA